MNAQDKKQLKWAIKAWQDYTDRERFLPAKNTGQRVVNCLKLELENGEPYCVCHLDKLKDCPLKSQSKIAYR